MNIAAILLGVTLSASPQPLTMILHDGNHVTSQPIMGFVYDGSANTLDVYTDRIFADGFELRQQPTED